MEHNNLRYIYKSIIEGINTTNDLEYFTNQQKDQNIDQNIDKNKDKNILDSLKYKLNNDYIGKIEFIELLDKLADKKYKEDIFIILDSYKQLDVCQNNTIQRILSNKPHQKYNIEINSSFSKNDNITKLCPHCKQSNSSYENNTYTICGYSNKEYDLIGCGFDWCFTCGKKLCKSWQDDELFLITNRSHNNTCCMKFAKKHDLDYENTFCFCKNSYVDRTTNTHHS
jgi:hypothetical protein